MSLVEGSYREQEETSLEVGASVEGNIDIGLLKLHFAGLAVTCQRVLKLKLTIQGDLVIEAVVDEQDPTVEINLIVVVLVQVQVQFSITSNEGFVGPAGAAMVSIVKGAIDVFVPMTGGNYLRRSSHKSEAQYKGPRGPLDGSSCHYSLTVVC